MSEAKRLITIASATKGNLFREFKELIDKIEHLKKILDKEYEKYGFKKVLSHNDVYEPNYIATKEGDLYLIDWEYAGINDEANDIACLISRYDFPDEQDEYYLESYFGRKLTDIEHRHYIAYLAINAFYWIGWGLYKEVLEKMMDSFFFKHTRIVKNM